MKLLKRIFPITFIFFVWIIFSFPYLFQDKVPFPSTYLVNFFSPWASYPGFSSPVKNNAMPDVIGQIYPWKNLTIDTLKNLQIPLWNPYSFSGTPHLANYQSAVLSPLNLLFFILPFIDAWSILVLIQPLLAGIFTYLFLKTQKLSNNSVLIGSISFMFCGFITTWMAYATLGYAILFLPLALFAIEKFYEKFKSRYLILLSLTVPLSFFSGHFQTSIYFFIFVFLYLIFKSFQVKNLKTSVYLLIYFGFGILFSLPQVLPSIELYAQSLRSGIFEKIEAIPWGYIPTFFAPDYLGNPVTRNDWFGHYAEWNAYTGLLPLILAFYAVFKKRTKVIWFFILTAILSIVFSFQTPFLDLLVFLKIPVLSTSAASRIIVIFSFSAAVLAAFGFEKLLEDIKLRKNKNIFVWVFITFLIFVILWLIVLLKLFIPLDKLSIARQNLILSTFIYLISSFLIFILVFVKNKKIFLFIPIVLILVVAFDLLRFANKWMPFDPKGLVYPNIPISKEFDKLSGFNRIFGNFGAEATMFYKIQSVNGYDAVYLRRYGEFIASLQNGKLSESARSVVTFPVNGLYAPKAINLLGINYIVNKKSDGHAPWNFPYWTYPPGTFPTIYSDDTYQIFENKNAFPRAFLVNKYKVETNPQKILNIMFSKDFDLRKEVVLEENAEKVDGNSVGSAKISNYLPNKISIETNSTGNSLLFLSDSFYPGWKATVDGKDAKIYRTDFTFRAVFVPRGNHIVKFTYFPTSFQIGEVAVMVGFAVMILIELKKRFKPTKT